MGSKKREARKRGKEMRRERTNEGGNEKAAATRRKFEERAETRKGEKEVRGAGKGFPYEPANNGGLEGSLGNAARTFLKEEGGGRARGREEG